MTTLDIIDIAKVSEYLSANEINTGKLFGKRVDTGLNKRIYTERKSVEWAYTLNPADVTLPHTSGYLLSLCGKYKAAATAIIGGAGGGRVTVTGYVSTPYLIQFSNTDFTDATHYNNPDLVGRTVKLFWNDIARFLYEGTEWVHTSTGIQILVPDFDATTNTYNFLAFIEGNVNSNNTASSNTPITVEITGQTGTYVTTADMLLRTLVVKVTNTQNVLIGTTLNGSEYFSDEVLANVPYEDTINTYVTAGTTIYFERDDVTPSETWQVILYIN